jgi:hypothetical protein
MKTRLIPAVAVLLLGLWGCGIPTDEEPRVVQPPPGPYQALASPPPSAAQTGTVVETLYLVRDDAIVPVQRRVNSEPTVEHLVQDLLAGPTAIERTHGVSSALPGIAVIDHVSITDGLAVVTMGSLEGISRTDEVLAYGQIVCTLEARTDVIGVVFMYQSEPVGVPRGDGSIATNPLTAADYEGLLQPR